MYREALITQIQFRKVVLGCGTIPKNLFFQSKQGKPFTNSELENNLQEMLKLLMEETEVVEKKLTYKDVETRHANVVNLKQELNNKKSETGKKS